MKHFFWGGRGGHGSGPPYKIAPEERGRHSPSTPLVMKVTSIVYNPPFQKFLDPPMLIAKASKFNMYIHNIHLHIFSIKPISPVIAVYKQTVFPISLNSPTIPYKNFGGYPWKKFKENIHESRLLCCNLYIVSPII